MYTLDGGGKMKKYISIRQAAEQWNISERRIQKLCKEKRIINATKFGNSWAIPANAKKPKDKRMKGNNNYYEDCSFIRIEKELYGKSMRVLSQNENCTVYYIENNTGNGVVTRYRIFSGIEVYYNDFHMSDGFSHKKENYSNVMEINHCREGRFECEFKSGGFSYLSEGDLGINMLSNQPKASFFPLAHYHGISIVIDVSATIKAIEKISSLLGNIKIDINIIQEKMNVNKDIFIMRATEGIEHIFSELYKAPNEFREGYLKVKIIELLMFLTVLDIGSSMEKKKYFSKVQVDTVKAIKNFLTEHLEQYITLQQLSDKFNIPLTSMKNCFKGVFGMPISTYIREYRLQAAAHMLQKTNESIGAISEKVGYENPSKFTVAFQKAMKQTPSDYRKNFFVRKVKF